MSVDWKQQERISKLEYMSIETSQTEMQRERETNNMGVSETQEPTERTPNGQSWNMSSKEVDLVLHCNPKYKNQYSVSPYRLPDINK